MPTIVKTPSGTWKTVIRKTGLSTTVKTFRLKRDAEDWARTAEHAGRAEIERLDDEAQGGAFEQGWLAGYAEPNAEHDPPLSPDLIEIYHEGETSGRNDRQSEWSQSGSIPGEPADGFDHFESAPNGILVPIPDTVGALQIRADAVIKVNPYGNGYYVAIDNVGNGASGEWLAQILEEAALHRLEELIAEAAKVGARGVLKYGGLAVSVILSLFDAQPLLAESRFRGYLPDGTPVSYVVLTPGE